MTAVGRPTHEGPNRGPLPDDTGASVPARTEWWLWPNVLALDAPAVALLWQRFLAASFGVTVPDAASAVLVLVVWGVYLADRQLDSRGGQAAEPRHRFAGDRPALVTSLAAAAFLAAGLLAVRLPAAYLVAGAWVAAFVAGYLALVHVTRRAVPGGKELLVGGLFAAGVSVPLVASGGEAAGWLPAACGFGAACWLNCRLIDRWESRRSRGSIREPVLAAAAVLCAVPSPAAVVWSIAVAVALLMAVHRLRFRAGPRLARVLADVALLTPAVFWA